MGMMRRLMTAALCAPLLLCGWGRDGHHLITRVAVRHLPADMPAFFTSAATQLEFLSTAPDEWRDRDESSLAQTLVKDRDPDHFFTWEWYSPTALPGDVYAYADAVRGTNKELAHMGLLPYAAMETFQRMRSDFRQWRKLDGEQKKFLEARIIQDAGLLAHYIEDASQPLHVTENYNGWKSEQNPRDYTRDNTLHRRFESDYVTAKIKDADVTPLLRPRQEGPLGLEYIYAEMQRSNREVNHLYDLEKAAAFGPEDQSEDAKKLVTARLADGASSLRDLWCAAFATSTMGAKPPATTPAPATTPGALR